MKKRALRVRGSKLGLIGKTINTSAETCSLPIYELEKTLVEKKHERVRPLPAAIANLSFEAWRLAHAIKKADFARREPNRILLDSALAFLREQRGLFDWNQNELRLAKGGAKLYNDITSTSIAGRVGQGMALLFLEERGYGYVGHFSTEWKKRELRTRPPSQKINQKAPDFIFENTTNDWVLAEAKGSFVSPGKTSAIKARLSEGLEQLSGWESRISPQPIKSFVIGTFIRENADEHRESSLVAIVDVALKPSENPVRFESDFIRSANYAGWLSVMGFENLATWLRGGESAIERKRVPVMRVNGIQYVLSNNAFQFEYQNKPTGNFWNGLENFELHRFLESKGTLQTELIGIELDVLKTIATAHRSGKRGSLLELNLRQTTEVAAPVEGSCFRGSVFSDGTLFGEMRLSFSQPDAPEIEWIEV